MDKEKILEFLRDLQGTLTDAYNTGHDSEINSDSLYYIDEAHGKVVDLIIELEKE
tara:strand:+ start:415 stop:579 length:165 start_codon:yes stop_codon:yes gene_type:complete